MKLPIRIVLDTNVLVSALLKGSSPPGQVLALILAGKVIPVLDERIFYEYATVLTRPRLKIPSQSAEKALTFLAAVGEWVESPSDLSLAHLQDPGDLPFAQAAIIANVWALVTGNERHFNFLAEHGVQVLTPAEFVSQIVGWGE